MAKDNDKSNTQRTNQDTETVPFGNKKNLYNNRALGTKKEELAAVFLQKRGYHIKERNFRCRTGEVDLIAEKDHYLVFVEVKYRTNAKKGLPEEAVNLRKQHVISKTAEYYLLTHGYGMQKPCRFDVVAIEGNDIRHYENAFPFCP